MTPLDKTATSGMIEVHMSHSKALVACSRILAHRSGSQHLGGWGAYFFIQYLIMFSESQGPMLRKDFGYMECLVDRSLLLAQGVGVMPACGTLPIILIISAFLLYNH
jgi:hypothetical protein